MLAVIGTLTTLAGVIAFVLVNVDVATVVRNMMVVGVGLGITMPIFLLHGSERRRFTSGGRRDLIDPVPADNWRIARSGDIRRCPGESFRSRAAGRCQADAARTVRRSSPGCALHAAGAHEPGAGGAAGCNDRPGGASSRHRRHSAGARRVPSSGLPGGRIGCRCECNRYVHYRRHTAANIDPSQIHRPRGRRTCRSTDGDRRLITMGDSSHNQEGLTRSQPPRAAVCPAIHGLSPGRRRRISRRGAAASLLIANRAKQRGITGL